LYCTHRYLRIIIFKSGTGIPRIAFDNIPGNAFLHSALSVSISLFFNQTRLPIESVKITPLLVPLARLGFGGFTILVALLPTDAGGAADFVGFIGIGF